MVPTQDIEGVRASHRTLVDEIARLTEDDIRKPSLLPDWTVAHVLAHIARNADSVVRRLQGAIDDVVVDQYAGGSQGRAREIEQSASLSVSELVEHVRSSADAVDAIAPTVPDEAWDRPFRDSDGHERPARYAIYSRWREAEIHLVDLGLGYTPKRWPEAFVARCLPDIVRDLPKRTDPSALMAWAIGRGPAPDVGDWI